mmetsp:Transcript_9832/g.17293  ORF Transcript_9832/g.17293 Transcript_9832/m.17293 type:complete len:165 (+) Transcript_9832:2934-3428(+)
MQLEGEGAPVIHKERPRAGAAASAVVSLLLAAALISPWLTIDAFVEIQATLFDDSLDAKAVGVIIMFSMFLSMASAAVAFVAKHKLAMVLQAGAAIFIFMGYVAFVVGEKPGTEDIELDSCNTSVDFVDINCTAAGFILAVIADFVAFVATFLHYRNSKNQQDS